MSRDHITLGAGLGGICLTNTKQALRSIVQDAADAVGAGRFVPPHPARTTVLRESMKKVGDGLFGRQRKRPIVVRQLDSPASFECVRVVTKPGATQNEYLFLFSASIDTFWNTQVLACDPGGPYSYVLAAHLDQAVSYQRDYLPGPVVSQVVVKTLKSWGALSLKDDGGAWFLDGQYLDSYRTMASMLRGKGDGPKFTVTQFEIGSDPDTVAHVLDCLHAEITAGVQEIMSDVMSAEGGMSDRSINCRTDRANKFLAKVQQYESLLGRPLPELTDAIEQTKQALAVNRLLAASV